MVANAQTHKIYGDPLGLLNYRMPYEAKRLLLYSLETPKEGHTVKSFLLARISSAAAAALIILSGCLLTLLSAFATTTFFAISIPLTLLSRAIPREKAQELAAKTTLLIERVLKIHWIGVRVIPLFIATATLNTFLPILTKEQAFNKIDLLVEELGTLQTVRMRSRKTKETIEGTRTQLNSLDSIEEYLRCLSSKNLIKEEDVDNFENNNPSRY